MQAVLHLNLCTSITISTRLNQLRPKLLQAQVSAVSRGAGAGCLKQLPLHPFLCGAAAALGFSKCWAGEWASRWCGGWTALFRGRWRAWPNMLCCLRRTGNMTTATAQRGHSTLNQPSHREHVEADVQARHAPVQHRSHTSDVGAASSMRADQLRVCSVQSSEQRPQQPQPGKQRPLGCWPPLLVCNPYL